jgi:hypothetical protein
MTYYPQITQITQKGNVAIKAQQDEKNASSFRCVLVPFRGSIF